MNTKGTHYNSTKTVKPHHIKVKTKSILDSSKHNIHCILFHIQKYSAALMITQRLFQESVHRGYIAFFDVELTELQRVI